VFREALDGIITEIESGASETRRGAPRTRFQPLFALTGLAPTKQSLMPGDRFGREINYLRISLIDHCNLRCVYCMRSRRAVRPSADLLTPSEIEVVARAPSRGFRRIRLTVASRPCGPIWSRSCATPHLPALEDLAPPPTAFSAAPRAGVVAAGLRRVNVHLDTPTRAAGARDAFRSLDDIWAASSPRGKPGCLRSS